MKTTSPYGSELIALLRRELEFGESALIKEEGEPATTTPFSLT